MKCITGIDTIKLQVDIDNPDDKYYVRDQLYSFINKNIESVQISRMEYTGKQKYIVYKNKRIILTIDTGSTITGKGLNTKSAHYVAMEFIGLRSHNDSLDKTSSYCLRRVVGFLNSNDIDCKVTELDIYFDIPCRVHHLLAFKRGQSPNILSNEVHDTQLYENKTKYTEKLEAKEQISEPIISACYYDKGLIYNKRFGKTLPFNITRFELKLQSKFISSNGCSVESIAKALNWYDILYLEDLHKRYSVLCYIKRNSYIPRNYIDPFILTPDLDSISYFLDELATASDYKTDDEIKGDSNEV